MELNAKRNISNILTVKRRKEIQKWHQRIQKETGVGRPQSKWTDGEIEYLKKNYKIMLVKDMALELDRSFASVNHKLTRLRLIYYNKWN